MRAQIQRIQQSVENASDKQAPTAATTIFHELLQGDLPDEEKAIERLGQEGVTIISAGTETTAWGNIISHSSSI